MTTLDPALKRLLNTHKLQRLDAHVSHDFVVIYAMPESWHPLVAQRRDEALARAAGPDGSLSLAQASKAGAEAQAAVALARGATWDEALAKLRTALKAVSHG